MAGRDMQMPRMNGADFLTAARKRAPDTVRVFYRVPETGEILTPYIVKGSK